LVFTQRDWTDAAGRSSGAGQKRKPSQSGATLHKFGKSAKTSNSYLCEKCPQLEFDGGQTDEGDPWFIVSGVLTAPCY